MSWLHKWKLSFLANFCINILKCGPMPQHVAFIMDGNRRYAVKNKMEKLQGHAFVFEKLSQTLSWCIDLGITEVTVYSFSIEKFKRSKEEVDFLMLLLKEKIKELVDDKEKLDEYGVCIRVFGDITLFPVDLQMLLAELVLYTYNNTNDVNETLLNSALYSSKSTDPDIVIRTSGEIGLSDFLLWQSCYSVLSFFDAFWPDFSIWHLFFAVLSYQHFHDKIKSIKGKHALKLQLKEETDDISYARQEIENLNTSSEESSSLEINEVLYQMDIRRRNFMNHLDSDHYERLIKIKNGDTVQNIPPVS